MDFGSQRHVVYGVDRRFVRPLTVSIASLVQRTKDVTVHVFHGSDLRRYNFDRIKGFVARHGSRVVTHEVDLHAVQGLPTFENFSSAAYLRLLAVDILAADGLRKVLYLDADVVTVDDLSPLFLMELRGATIGAVAELSNARNHVLGLAPDSPYFNSGVMLIDVTEWSRQSVSQAAIRAVKSRPSDFIYVDQDALNVVLESRWLPLAPKFNVYTGFYRSKKPPPEVAAALESPAIVHYTEGYKPWMLGSRHPAIHYWREAKRQSPLAWYPPEPPRLEKVVAVMKRKLMAQGRILRP